MLRVQKYLKKKTLSHLKREHGVKYKIEGHKVVLNYNQLEARDGDLLAGECRGLILRRTTKGPVQEDEFFDAEVLAFAFPRFYNLGQHGAAKLDEKTIQIEEKLDGTLTLLYWDDVTERWCVSTRSMPEANLEIQGFDFTFRDLFEKALREQYNTNIETLEMHDQIRKGWTYAFELTSPYNRIVVKYPKTELTLLCARSPELEDRTADAPNLEFFKRPKHYDLSSVEEIVKYVNEQEPTEQEGVILVDKDFNRVKIKSLSYCMFNRLRDKVGSSYRNCLTLCLEDKVDDLIGKLPIEIEEILLKMREEVGGWIKANEEVYDRVVKESTDDYGLDMKKFSNLISRESATNDVIWAAPHFGVARGKSDSIKDWVVDSRLSDGKYKKATLNKILKSLGYRDRKI